MIYKTNDLTETEMEATERLDHSRIDATERWDDSRTEPTERLTHSRTEATERVDHPGTDQEEYQDRKETWGKDRVQAVFDQSLQHKNPELVKELRAMYAANQDTAAGTWLRNSYQSDSDRVFNDLRDAMKDVPHDERNYAVELTVDTLLKPTTKHLGAAAKDHRWQSIYEIRKDLTESLEGGQSQTFGAALNNLNNFHNDILTEKLESSPADRNEHSAKESSQHQPDVPEKQNKTLLEHTPANSEKDLDLLAHQLAQKSKAENEKATETIMSFIPQVSDYDKRLGDAKEEEHIIKWAIAKLMHRQESDERKLVREDLKQQLRQKEHAAATKFTQSLREVSPTLINRINDFQVTGFEKIYDQYEMLKAAKEAMDNMEQDEKKVLQDIIIRMIDRRAASYPANANGTPTEPALEEVRKHDQIRSNIENLERSTHRDFWKQNEDFKQQILQSGERAKERLIHDRQMARMARQPMRG